MTSTLDPIVRLSWLVGGIAAVILVGVCAALVLFLVRYRARPGVEAQQVHGHSGLEIAWTVAPLLILAVVFVASFVTLRDLSAAGNDRGAAALRIEAVGRQWWFDYRYDERTVVPNELHIPVGVPIDLALGATDVVHSFWVPELGPKMDMVPGQTRVLRLYAGRPGLYHGACAEFCGVEHAWMRIRIVAEPRADFERWLAGQRADQPMASTTLAAGEQVFLSTTCVSCHAIRGTSAAATVGPDLTHFAGRETIASGVLPNDREGLRDWLADPQRFKPGSFMPRVALSDRDLDALVVYLESLR